MFLWWWQTYMDSLQLQMCCKMLCAACTVLLSHKALAEDPTELLVALAGLSASTVMYGGSWLTRNQWGERKVCPNRAYWRGAMQQPNRQFKANFRMDKATYFAVEKRLWASMQEADKAKRGRRAINKRGGRRMTRPSFRRRLLMTVWFLATGASYREVGELFGYEVNYETLFVKEIAAMKENYVQWPAGDAECMRVAADFSEMRGFTGCVGAIDGTYIKILAPWQRTVAPDEWNTYKKFYATTLLAVADSHMRIRYMNVGWPGSRTDAHILKQTKLFACPQQYVPTGYYMFGDAGFPNYHWLITPYSKSACQRDPWCRDFNYNQASTRVVVEQVRASQCAPYLAVNIY